MPIKDLIKRKEYARKQYLKNKELPEFIQKRKEYRKKTNERRCEYNQEWRDNNREKYNTYHRKYNKADGYRVSWRGAKSRCVNKGSWYWKNKIRFLLSIAETKKLWERDNGRLMMYPELDRINPRGNYEYNNCRFIERQENQKRKRVRCIK